MTATSAESSRARLHAVVLASGLVVAGGALAAVDVETLLGDPERARSHDYCALLASVADAQPGAEPASGVEPLRAAANSVLDAPRNEADALRLAAALLVKAGLDIAEAADGPRDCRRRFARGERLYDSKLAPMQRRLRREARFDEASDPAIADAQQRIADQWLADQSTRSAYLALQSAADSGRRLWANRRVTAELLAIDARSTALMRELLGHWDWIDRQRFGARVSQQAWLLVQHADRHPDFQALALERMKPHLETDGVRPANYAYLFDRVAVNHGRAQRYGTQPLWICERGRVVQRPIEDREMLDARRAEFGLGPFEPPAEPPAAGSDCG